MKLWKWITQLFTTSSRPEIPEPASRGGELDQLERMRDRALRDLDAEIRLTRARRGKGFL